MAPSHNGGLEHVNQDDEPVAWGDSVGIQRRLCHVRAAGDDRVGVDGPQGIHEFRRREALMHEAAPPVRAGGDQLPHAYAGLRDLHQLEPLPGPGPLGERDHRDLAAPRRGLQQQPRDDGLAIGADEGMLRDDEGSSGHRRAATR